MTPFPLYKRPVIVLRTKRGFLPRICSTPCWRVDVRMIDSWAKLAALYASKGRL